MTSLSTNDIALLRMAAVKHLPDVEIALRLGWVDEMGGDRLGAASRVNRRLDAVYETLARRYLLVLDAAEDLPNYGDLRGARDT